MDTVNIYIIDFKFFVDFEGQGVNMKGFVEEVNLGLLFLYAGLQDQC